MGGVGDDAPVEHLDPAWHACGDALVVGDHHDGGAGRVQLVEQREDGLPGGLVEVAGGLVGQDDRRWPTRARAIATRWRCPPESWVGRACSRSARPTAASASAARSRGAARAGRRRRAARRRRCRAAVACSARKNCWNTNPIRLARSAASCRSDKPATSKPVILTVPAVGRSRLPITCSSVVLPDPDGPTTATNSPAHTVRLTSRSAVTGGTLGRSS